MDVKEHFTQEVNDQFVAVNKKRSTIITKEEYLVHIAILKDNKDAALHLVGNSKQCYDALKYKVSKV
jgi:hypothetical protein